MFVLAYSLGILTAIIVPPLIGWLMTYSERSHVQHRSRAVPLDEIITGHRAPKVPTQRTGRHALSQGQDG